MMVKQQQESDNRNQPGIGVGARGDAVVDPTKNVLDLVRAESKYQDAMRDALKEYQDGMRDALREQQELSKKAENVFQNFAREMESKFQTGLLNGETRRIDQLASLRQDFQNTIRDMLAESVRTTSTLVSTQLVQIQATFDTRVSKLEAFQFTQAGRSSVSDPATADALARMAAGITALSASTTENMSKISSTNAEAMAKLTITLTGLQSAESRHGGQAMGMKDTNARLLAIVMACAAVASPVVSILVTIMVMRGGR